MLFRFAASFAIVSALSMLNPEIVRADIQVPFPAAASGQYEVSVPYLLAAGADGLVEVTIGKTMRTDSCNSYAIYGDTLSQKTVAGWGASYYVFQVGAQEGVSMSRVYCGGEEQSRFVAASVVPEDSSPDAIAPSAGKFFIRNKQSGTTFYLPEGYQLHYRVWAPTTAEFSASRLAADQGAQPADSASQESDLQAAANKPAASYSDGVVGGQNPAFAAGRSPAM